MHKFQLRDFQSIEPSLMALKYGRMPPWRRFWFERTKKSAKDSDLALMVIWLVSFTEKPLLIQICAANNKQARIIEDRAVDILFWNPWLNEFVEVIENKVRSRKNPRRVRAKIEATGTAGEAQGPTPDLLILNELVHVDRWATMEAHLNNAAGVPRGVVIVSTNAGIKGTKAWSLRKLAIASPDRWQMSIRSKPAPWVDPKDVAEARKSDPIGSEAARLWDGIWISGAGDALSEADIDRMFVHTGPMKVWTSGCIFLLGLDLGVKKDHGGVTLVAVNKKERTIRVSRVRGFVPTKPNDKGVLEVDGRAIKRYLLGKNKQFQVARCWYDQAAGGSFMAQELRDAGMVMREADFNKPSWQTKMAQCLVQCVKQGILECYEDPEGRLRRDFGKFFIEHKPPNKYKLLAVSDENGHADVGFALAMILPDAVSLLGGTLFLNSDDVIVDDDDSELSDEEKDNMPEEFQELDRVLEQEREDHRLNSIYGVSE